MNCAIYIRVSTDEQANEGFSIEAQKRRLLAYAESQDWTVTDIFIDDGYSAKDTNRPELQRFLFMVDQFNILLVYKLDRLTRSAADCDRLLKLLDQNSVSFQSASESFETRTATGRLFIRIIADLAQWERENIAERVRFAMEQMVHEGKRPGARLPFGYSKDGTIIEEEAEIIRDIRRQFLDGYGYRTIALNLNRSGRFRRGKEWRQFTVGYTLENPYYAGIIRFGTKNSQGKYVNGKRGEKVDCIYSESNHPAIWTQEEFEEHMELIRRKAFGGYSRIKEYWFSGVLRCGRCGSAMVGRLTTKRETKKGTKRTQYYVCSNRHEGRECDMPIFRQIHVEHLLLNEMQSKYVIESDIANESRITKKKSDIENLKSQLNKIKERRKKWQYLFAENMMTSEELRERLKADEQEEQDIQSRLQEIPSAPINIAELKTFIDFWNVADDSEKKKLIHATFENLMLHTDLTKVKGVRNKFFDSKIELKYQ
jgi:site-specific DNA recombinase